jgi:hypothetical protein
MPSRVRGRFPGFGLEYGPTQARKPNHDINPEAV